MSLYINVERIKIKYIFKKNIITIYIMYTFTTEDIKKWEVDKNVNPKTGSKINPNKKNGISTQIMDQKQNDLFMEKHQKECQNIPLSVLSHILSLKKKLHEDNTRIQRYKKLQDIFSYFSMTKFNIKTSPVFHDYQFIAIDNFKPILSYFNNTINVNYNCDTLKMNQKGFSFMYQFSPNNQCSTLEFYLNINKINGPKLHDFQYQNTSSTFWSKLNPQMNVIITLDKNNEKKLSFKFYLFRDVFLKLNRNGISMDTLKQQLKENDNHPLLKIFRENFRMSIDSFDFLLQKKTHDAITQIQNKYLEMSSLAFLELEEENIIDDIKRNNEPFKIKLLESLHICVNDFLVKRNIDEWIVTTCDDDKGILDLKFEKNDCLLKKRIQKILNPDGNLRHEVFKAI